jgi:hypothetical protein
MDAVKASATLLNGLSWNNKDNYTYSDLEDIANQTGKYANSSDELAAAAKWFIAHPEEFTKMEMNQANQQDNYFTKGNLDAYISHPNQKGEYDTKGNLNPEYM